MVAEKAAAATAEATGACEDTFTAGFLAGYDDTERGNTQMDTAHIVSILTDLRQTIEVEAGASCLEVETTLALALDDVCRALCLGPSQTREVLGDEAVSAVYGQGTPVALACDQWPDLREQVRQTYAKSRNVTIYAQPDPAAAFQAAARSPGICRTET